MGSSTEVPDVDPQNTLLARQTRLRVEAEIVRDLSIDVAGLLSKKIGGPSVFPALPAGSYLFKLTSGAFDTRRLKDAVYQLTVTAWDTAGNHSSTAQIFQVHNRATWLKG